MEYSIEKLKEFSGNLINEIEKARSGSITSLAYAHNYIPEAPHADSGEQFQVIMMGGSHLESVGVSVNKGEVNIHSDYEEELPKLVSRELVCELFSTYVNPNTKIVALNFAYPMKAVLRDNLLDGILIGSSKEHTFDGLMHKTVGYELERYLYSRYGRNVAVTVCNDTVALGLASYNLDPKYDWRNTIVGVVGTGVNFGLFDDKNSFINLESGNFPYIEKSHSGTLIDSMSSEPGRQLLEKEVSGAYLWQHFNIIAESRNFDISVNSTKELSKLAAGEGEASEIARNIFRRSASLVAMKIYALHQIKKTDYKKEKGNAPDKFPMLVLIEGSLCWKGYRYYDYIYEYLNTFGIADEIKIHIIDRIGIVGAAKLVRRY